MDIVIERDERQGGWVTGRVGDPYLRTLVKDENWEGPVFPMGIIKPDGIRNGLIMFKCVTQESE